jgi:hypothetical protein
MFEKGQSFVMGAGLVRAYDGHKLVYLHLLCQGLECIGKAALLRLDFAGYEMRLKDDLGHDLEVLVREVESQTGEPLFTAGALKELRRLNQYYKKHILRYGSLEDLKKQTQSISADVLHGEVVELIPTLGARVYATGEA